jgi:uncharacterized protein (TIGR02284 family)
MSYKSTLKHELERLAIHTNDSVQGYVKAAERVENEDAALALRLREIENRRSVHLAALNSRLECIGETKQERGSLEGHTHRALIRVKDMFTASENTDAVIDEALRGEQKLLDYIQDTFDDVALMDGETVRVIHELKLNVQQSAEQLQSVVAA